MKKVCIWFLVAVLYLPIVFLYTSDSTENGKTNNKVNVGGNNERNTELEDNYEEKNTYHRKKNENDDINRNEDEANTSTNEHLLKQKYQSEANKENDRNRQEEIRNFFPYENEDYEEDYDEEGKDDEIEIELECAEDGCSDKIDEINKLINAKKEKIKYHKNIGKPLQIIKPNVNHTELILIEENLKILKNIEKPIAIVSVLGDMHTGKSFLLNLLNDHLVYDLNKSRKKTVNNGFKVGNDVTASTYGIWIWSEPIKVNVKKLRKIYEDINTNFTHFIKTYEYEKDEYNEEIIDLLNLYKTDDWITEINKLNIPETEEVNLILMDTQGFNSPNVNKRYDETLYALANLISTDIIFLTMKMINNKDIEFIENITKDANLFMLRAYTRSSGSTFSINKNNFDKIVDNLQYVQSNSLVLESVASKNLMWVVHDFTQRLDVKKGKLWLNILLNSDRRDLDIKYWKKVISNKNKEKHDAYTTKNKKIAYLAAPGKEINGETSRTGTNFNYKLGILYKNIDCVLLRSIYNNKEIDFTNVNLNHLNEEYKMDMTLLKYKIYLRALLYPKKIYSSMHHGDFFKENLHEVKHFGESNTGEKNTEWWDKIKVSKNLFSEKNETTSEKSGKEEKGIFTNRYMSGEDVYDFISFLVKSANQNLFTNVNQFFKQFKVSRAEISRNDLIFLYKKYLLQFMEKEEVELFSNLNEEDDTVGNTFNVLESFQDTMSEEGKCSESDAGECSNKKHFKDAEADEKYESGKKMPPLIIEIQKYEELIRKQILNIWYKYKESDFHDEEEKELIKYIEQSLYERIEQIRSEMLELGESNIQKFCRIACEDALQIVIEDVKMKTEQFPIKQKDLVTFFESVSYNLLKYLEKKLSKNPEKLDLIYYTDPLCNNLINNTYQEFHFLKSKNIGLNEKKLKQYFANGVTKAKEVFEMLANNPENITEYFKNKNVFFSVLDKWKVEAVNMYITTLNEFYKEEKELGQEYLNVLENGIKLLKTKALEKWHQHCREKTSALYNLHTSNLKKNFMENFNFPLDELVLEDIYLSLKSQEELKYTDMYCANEESWHIEYKKFLKLSDDIYKFIKDENLRAIQVTCQQPLDDLKNGIQKEIHKYYLWRTLRKTLYNRAIIVLSNNIENIYLKNKRENKVQSMIDGQNVESDHSNINNNSAKGNNINNNNTSTNTGSNVKNKYAKRISKELMSKVINRWLDNDIYKLYSPIIRKQFIHKVIFYIGICMILAVIFAILYFKKFHWTFFIFIFTGIFMIFGCAQIGNFVRKFFRRAILYSYEGTSHVFGVEGAIIFFILVIAGTSIYIYTHYIVKLKNKAPFFTSNLLSGTQRLNVFPVNTETAKDANSNSSRINSLYKPNIMNVNSFDKSTKHSFTPYVSYKSNYADTTFNNLTHRHPQNQSPDEYATFIKKNKISRNSFLT